MEVRAELLHDLREIYMLPHDLLYPVEISDRDRETYDENFVNLMALLKHEYAKQT